MQEAIAKAIMDHIHDGNFSQRINWFNIFAFVDSINVSTVTIGTAAANYDAYVIASVTGSVVEVDFSALDALAADNTNYITWTITNLGQAGAGTAAILLTGSSNTTKATGGSAISANTKRAFTLTDILNNLNVVQGDRIRIRATVTGTLANSVTFPVYLLQTQTQ